LMSSARHSALLRSGRLELGPRQLLPIAKAAAPL